MWMVGSSLIKRLEEYVFATRAGDHSLGLSSRIVWMGSGGMCWNGAIACLRRSRRLPKPRVIVLHVGGNDLGGEPWTRLVSRMKRDLRWVLTEFPETTVLFSHILPRMRFWGQRDASSKALNLAGRRMSKEISTFLHKRGHGAIRHDGIRLEANVLDDRGVHLNDRGNEIFLNDFKYALTEVLSVNVQ